MLGLHLSHVVRIGATRCLDQSTFRHAGTIEYKSGYGDHSELNKLRDHNLGIPKVSDQSETMRLSLGTVDEFFSIRNY